MKKILILILSITCLFLLFSNFTLVKTNFRPIKNIEIPTWIKQKIQNETRNMNSIEIVNYCLKLTSDTLSFSEKTGNLNCFESQTTNCVGYAQFYTTICNYAFKVNNCESRCIPVVGYVNWYNINMCNIAHKICYFTKYRNFVKDHDFVEIQNRDFTFYTDPCLYDILGSDFKSLIIN